jgi:hypothetical protein
MRKRTPANSNKSSSVKRERDPIPWKYCILTLFCGLLLVGGFFVAARQHFSVMDFAIKNAKLRREKENLESEQRRLYLTREISISPAEIKKAAKKIGLQELTAQSIQIMMPKKATDKKQTDKPADASNQAFLSQTENAKSTKNDKDIKKVADKKVTKDVKTNAATAGITRQRVDAR